MLRPFCTAAVTLCLVAFAAIETTAQSSDLASFVDSIASEYIDAGGRVMS